MAHANLHDGAHDHPKILALLYEADGLAAIGLWTLLIAWAYRHTRENGPEGAGIIEPNVPRYLAQQPVDHLVELLSKQLMDGHAPLLEDLGGGRYRLHDFWEWQTLALRDERRASISELRQEVGRIGGIKSGQSRKAAAQAALPGMDEPNHEANASPIAITTTGTGTKPKSSKPLLSAARFAEFWEIYPRKVGKIKAREAWAKALQQGATPDEIITGARQYRDKPGRTAQFTAFPATWLNQGRWDDEDEPDPTAGGTWRPP